MHTHVYMCINPRVRQDQQRAALGWLVLSFHHGSQGSISDDGVFAMCVFTPPELSHCPSYLLSWGTEHCRILMANRLMRSLS